eukprot:GHVQ01013551.1.p1 GENE.GHVQ01013551.1~~GHVQ01013551.1.p1  ORF type:complete len:1252 (+),score=180.39 GHVQ01013551.1:317-4072(+)
MRTSRFHEISQFRTLWWPFSAVDALAVRLFILCSKKMSWFRSRAAWQRFRPVKRVIISVVLPSVLFLLLCLHAVHIPLFPSVFDSAVPTGLFPYLHRVSQHSASTVEQLHCIPDSDELLASSYSPSFPVLPEASPSSLSVLLCCDKRRASTVHSAVERDVSYLRSSLGEFSKKPLESSHCAGDQSASYSPIHFDVGPPYASASLLRGAHSGCHKASGTDRSLYLFPPPPRLDARPFPSFSECCRGSQQTGDDSRMWNFLRCLYSRRDPSSVSSVICGESPVLHYLWQVFIWSFGIFQHLLYVVAYYSVSYCLFVISYSCHFLLSVCWSLFHSLEPLWSMPPVIPHVSSDTPSTAGKHLPSVVPSHPVSSLLLPTVHSLCCFSSADRCEEQTAQDGLCRNDTGECVLGIGSCINSAYSRAVDTVSYIHMRIAGAASNCLSGITSWLVLQPDVGSNSITGNTTSGVNVPPSSGSITGLFSSFVWGISSCLSVTCLILRSAGLYLLELPGVAYVWLVTLFVWDAVSLVLRPVIWLLELGMSGLLWLLLGGTIGLAIAVAAVVVLVVVVLFYASCLTLEWLWGSLLLGCVYAGTFSVLTWCWEAILCGVLKRLAVGRVGGPVGQVVWFLIVGGWVLAGVTLCFVRRNRFLTSGNRMAWRTGREVAGRAAQDPKRKQPKRFGVLWWFIILSSSMWFLTFEWKLRNVVINEDMKRFHVQQLSTSTEGLGKSIKKDKGSVVCNSAGVNDLCCLPSQDSQLLYEPKQNQPITPTAVSGRCMDNCVKGDESTLSVVYLLYEVLLLGGWLPTMIGCLSLRLLKNKRRTGRFRSLRAEVGKESMGGAESNDEAERSREGKEEEEGTSDTSADLVDDNRTDRKPGWLRYFSLGTNVKILADTDEEDEYQEEIEAERIGGGKRHGSIRNRGERMEVLYKQLVAASSKDRWEDTRRALHHVWGSRHAERRRHEAAASKDKGKQDSVAITPESTKARTRLAGKHSDITQRKSFKVSRLASSRQGDRTERAAEVEASSRGDALTPSETVEGNLLQQCAGSPVDGDVEDVSLSLVNHRKFIMERELHEATLEQFYLVQKRLLREVSARQADDKVLKELQAANDSSKVQLLALQEKLRETQDIHLKELRMSAESESDMSQGNFTNALKNRIIALEAQSEMCREQSSRLEKENQQLRDEIEDIGIYKVLLKNRLSIPQYTCAPCCFPSVLLLYLSMMLLLVIRVLHVTLKIFIHSITTASGHLTRCQNHP